MKAVPNAGGRLTIKLTLLGSTDLVGADGVRLDVILAQPKRFALFAYLAVDRPLRFHRRDALLLLFWPESDEEHARGALSQALSFLRRALGEGVIATRGADQVGIEEGRVSIDVARFEAAADGGQHERALAHYGGDLLVGFHLDGCHEFDDWLHAERTRLRDRAGQVAGALAKEAAALPPGSIPVRLAKQALLFDPLNEAAAERVMLSQQAAGRPAMGVHEYEQFRQRLRKELGVEPSAKLQQLAAQLRGG